MDLTGKRLEASELRITRQRQVILDEFKNPDSHLTADEVYYKVRKKIPRVSLGTIYRNLEVLSEYGLIHKIELAGHQKLFDGNLKRHYHFRCLNCDKLIDVPAESIAIDTSRIENKESFKVSDIRLELLGTCRECSRKR
jgi:Fur family ferric uptake transcriptional regulator